MKDLDKQCIDLNKELIDLEESYLTNKINLKKRNIDEISEEYQC